MRGSTVGRLAQCMAAAAVLIAVTARCSDGDPATPSKAAGVTAPDEGVASRAPATAEATARARSAMDRGAWAGEIHRRAMAELIADRAAWRGARQRSAAENCAIAWRLAARFADEISRQVGPRAAAQRRRMPAGLEEQLGCPRGSGSALVHGGAARLSVFAQEDSALPPGVTGEYEQYGPALAQAYDYASTPSQVESATRTVINQAAANGLGQPDLDFLAVIANISISSAYQWYEYEQSGGFENKGDDGQNAMSLFQQTMNTWGRVGVADLGGALMGSRGGPWWALAGGIVASSVYAINAQ